MCLSLDPGWMSPWAQHASHHGLSTAERSQPSLTVDLSLDLGSILACTGAEDLPSPGQALVPAALSLKIMENILARCLSISNFWGGRPPGKRKQGSLFPISGGGAPEGGLRNLSKFPAVTVSREMGYLELQF